MRRLQDTLVKTVALMWGVRALCALLVAFPMAQALMGTGLDRFEDSDRRVFEAGGMLLLEALRLGSRSLGSVARSSVVTLMIVLTVQLIPLGALIAAVQNPKARAAQAVARGAQAFPAFLSLSGLTVLAQAIWLVFCASAAGGLADPLHAALNEPAADCVMLAVAGAAALGYSLCGVILDLARTEVIRGELRAFAALSHAIAVLARHPVRTLIGWAAPAVWAVVSVGAAALVVAQVDVSRPGTWRLLSVFLIHQLAALAWVVLRGRWLATASQLTHRSLSP